jgi:hypothetical protein
MLALSNFLICLTLPRLGQKCRQARHRLSLPGGRITKNGDATVSHGSRRGISRQNTSPEDVRLLREAGLCFALSGRQPISRPHISSDEN